MVNFEMACVRQRVGYLAVLSAAGALLALFALFGCSARNPQTSRVKSVIQPIASIQELMQAEVDASADRIWESVESTTSKAGDEEKQPRTAEEWEAVRHDAIVLIEAGNLLTVDGRGISRAPFQAEAAGALDSNEIERRIAANRAAFNSYALTLSETGRTMLAAIDAKDPEALVTAGGVLNEVCESCHLTFWYPNQVIPAWPRGRDPRFGKSVKNPAN